MLEETLPERMRNAVHHAWNVFAKKVGGGTINVNKEASMQLQVAYLLEHLVPLLTFDKGDRFQIELETGIRVNGALREVDLIFKGHTHELEWTIGIEMKCYKKLAASRKLRGATDIFMKDVYVDLESLESYAASKHISEGVALVMTNLERLVHPKAKKGKCWAYDTSHGTHVSPGTWTTPIGGNSIELTLKNHYRFDWKREGEFYFLENRPINQQP
jgi:hypothetical protein